MVSSISSRRMIPRALLVLCGCICCSCPCLEGLVLYSFLIFFFLSFLETCIILNVLRISGRMCTCSCIWISWIYVYSVTLLDLINIISNKLFPIFWILLLLLFSSFSLHLVYLSPTTAAMATHANHDRTPPSSIPAANQSPSKRNRQPSTLFFQRISFSSFFSREMTSIAEGLFKSLPKPKYTGEEEQVPQHAQPRGPRVVGADQIDETQIVLRVSCHPTPEFI